MNPSSNSSSNAAATAVPVAPSGGPAVAVGAAAVQPGASTSADTPPAGGSTPPLATVHYLEAYQQALPAAQALDLEALIAVNIDLPSAVTTALGVLPAILALRDRVAKELPTFDVSYFDQLETYALATAQAHALYLGASAPPRRSSS